MSNTDGYTLAETLVALLILGLAMGGLMQASLLLGHLQQNAQRNLNTFEAGRRLQQEFSVLFADYGPFPSSSRILEGAAEGFQFACGTSLCGARLTDGRLELRAPAASQVELGGRFAGHFEYVGDAGASDDWPGDGRAEQRLQAVQLVDGGHGDVPIATARVWKQEAPGCVFDTIAKDCRGAP